jgi:predicted DNA-binding transcriptional regulator AlpA
LGGQETHPGKDQVATANNTLGTLLNEHDVARITGLSVASVRRRRLFRQWPKYLKIGAAVLYKPEDISAWLEFAIQVEWPARKRDRLWPTENQSRQALGIQEVPVILCHEWTPVQVNKEKRNP